MAFAPRIRKEILRALVERIIPSLQNEPVPQIPIVPSREFPGLECRVLHKSLLPNRDGDSLQVFSTWPDVGMEASRAPLLQFLYEGTSEERLGVTVGMGEELHMAGLPVKGGVIGIKIPAPAAFYFPPHVPHGNGTYPFESHEPVDVLPIRLLRLEMQRNEITLQLFESDTGVTHQIQTGTPALARMVSQYCASLLSSRKGTAGQDNEQLLIIMKLLRDSLVHSKAIVYNSAWPSLEFRTSPKTSQRSQLLCRQTADYIQMHLHCPLTLGDLALQAGVSSAHLNRVFVQATGMTLMRFVTLRRIEAAKMILAGTNERIGDVALLTGFSSAESFSMVFRSQAGLSPREYRQQAHS